jgi:DNA modification methylase
MKLGCYEVNNIYNEDSYSAVKKIPDKSVDQIYIDIPYLYEKGGQSGCLLGKRLVNIHKQLKDISDGIDYKIFDDFVRILKKINIFIWCSKHQIPDILNYFLEFNVNYEILVWCKSNPVPKNQSWLSDIEYCLYFREKNFPLNTGYEFKSKFFVSSINMDDKLLYDHPTIKPLEFVKNHILHTTQENDIICDFFLGSGTSCVAVKELNRQYLGFGINKQYFDVACDRLNQINVIDRKNIDNGFLTIYDFLKPAV